MPATSTINTVATTVGMTGGVTAVTGRGPTWIITISGTWAVADQFVAQLVLPAQTYDFGTGRVTGVVPVSAVTLYDRVHFVASTKWYGSDNGDSTAWEQQAPGAFVINVANQSAQPENLLALAPFQGRMALWSRRTTQLWVIDANPLNITQQQVLSNVGIVSPFAAQSLGDFDVLFPSDSGIRSLRVQSINLNGFISDIGSPIDTLEQAAIQGQSVTQLAGICSVVEPVGNRFMIYFPSVGLVYVLSYFPSSKIIAWASYALTIGDIEAPPVLQFNIQSFRTYNSVVYYRANCINGTSLPNGTTNFIGCYGTPDGTTLYMYDNTHAQFTLPWLDLKSPGKRKKAQSIDYALQSQWDIKGSMDYNGVTNNAAALQVIAHNAGSLSSADLEQGSFQTGSVDWSDDGFHVQLQAKLTNTVYPAIFAKFSELVLYYKEAEEK